MFKKLKPNLFKEKSQEELNKHYDSLDLEKNDLLAMIIAAFITFLPILIVVVIVIILVANLFI